MQTKKCPSCGSNNLLDVLRCRYCGASFSAVRNTFTSFIELTDDDLKELAPAATASAPVQTAEPDTASKSSQANDFEIKNGLLKKGVLKKYKGKGGDVVIPDGVTVIGNEAFAFCVTLTSITIPDSVTSIGDYAFCGCSTLTSVTISGSVKSIGDSAFIKCKSLASIIIPDSVISIGNSAFDGCDNITVKCNSRSYAGRFCRNNNIKHSELADEEQKAFASAKLSSSSYKDFKISGTVLKKYKGNGGDVIIPDGVTKIGDSAFYYCSTLTSVTIPEGVTSIGDNAFCGCSSLTSVIIPNGMTSIGDFAFDKCTSLTKVFIPYSVTKIGGYAFANLSIDCKEGSYAENYCKGNMDINYTILPVLKQDLPEEEKIICSSIEDFEIVNGVLKKYIGKGGDVIISFGVRTIGVNAFDSCNTLTSITILDKVTSIGDEAFYGCTSLETVTIHNGLRKIGNSAFMGCIALTDITIPESVTDIDDKAFSLCKALKSITIPDSVTKLGNDVFDGCEKLTIKCDADSYLVGYCKRKKIRYKTIR